MMGTQEDEIYWQAVQENDASYDGVFVLAVKTTGIYCRPTCTARMPLRKNVEFYSDPDAAEAAGYRACKRCLPRDERPPQSQMVVEICRYLEQPHDKLPTLAELSERFHISQYHLQRTFKKIVGVSPRQYADSHRQGRVKAALQETERVTDAIFDAGYETSSNFYQTSQSILGMTPVTYRQKGKAMNITYMIAPCRLGYVLVGATEKGVCKITLGDAPADLIEDIEAEYKGAALVEESETLSVWVRTVLDYIEGEAEKIVLPLDIQATAFQRKVWEALRNIPYGETRSYTEVAQQIGQPTAARAVAGACASNKVALAIPCHRVVRSDGSSSGYRWGTARKDALLKMEAEIEA